MTQKHNVWRNVVNFNLPDPEGSCNSPKISLPTGNKQQKRSCFDFVTTANSFLFLFFLFFGGWRDNTHTHTTLPSLKSMGGQPFSPTTPDCVWLQPQWGWKCQGWSRRSTPQESHPRSDFKSSTSVLWKQVISEQRIGDVKAPTPNPYDEYSVHVGISNYFVLFKPSVLNFSSWVHQTIHF